MKNFIVVKTKEYMFNNKTETFNMSGSESDCFDVITKDIDTEKIEWSNITDKTRNYEVNTSNNIVELRVHQNQSIRSNVVCTVKYEIRSI